MKPKRLGIVAGVVNAVAMAKIMNLAAEESNQVYDTEESEREDDVNVVRSTSITVAVRKRPKIKNREDRENDVVRGEGDGSTITVYAPKMRVDLTPVIEPTTFSFDNVFDERATNDDVYRTTTKPLLDTVRRGGSAVVFAFGQTGSGKTYTMLGNSELDPGIYSLAVADMLALVDHQVTLTASFYEVYGPKLYDLLNERGEVKVLQDEYKNIHIMGLRERSVDSTADLTELMRQGQVLRACGTTSANDRSSRSHAVLVLNLRQLTGTDDGNQLFGRMTFVDLAGSERAHDVQGFDKQTRREGAEINKSLLALKECIRAMGLKKRHIPFRGSKLTQILRESFIGNCQTCVIANVSPCQSHCEDTLNTLRYADRIKSLKANNAGDDGGAPIPCVNCGLPIFVGDRHVCRKIVSQCPHCRAEMDKERLDAHVAECKEAPMRCPHCNDRFLQGDAQKHNRRCTKFPTRCGPCGEIVPRNLMEKHVQTECMQSKGACRYCRGQFLRMDLAQHEESCGHMQICCHYCLMIVKKAKMDAHMAECSNNPQRIQRIKPAPVQSEAAAALARKPSMHRHYTTSPQPPGGLQPVKRGRPVGSARVRSPIPQPPVSPPPQDKPSNVLKPRHMVGGNSQSSCRYCARFVPQALMQNHIKSDCMYVPVPCPYQNYGCRWESLRAKLAAHILESTTEHLEMVQQFAYVVSKENEALKEKIAALELRGGQTPAEVAADGDAVLMLSVTDSPRENNIVSPPLVTRSLGVNMDEAVRRSDDGSGLPVTLDRLLSVEETSYVPSTSPSRDATPAATSVPREVLTPSPTSSSQEEAAAA